MNPLRLVIFTQSPLSPYTDVFFRRLIKDSDFQVVAIIVEDYAWPTRSLWERVKKDGIEYLIFRLHRKISGRFAEMLWRRWLRDHPVLLAEPSFDRFAQAGVAVYRTPDIHGTACIDYVRSLGADLGVIYGSRILKESILSLPRLGVLNIHKRKVPEYRGGGRVGYWELLNGEKETAVTIHYATAKVDEGPILAKQTIPIEPYDTMDSLEIKAGVAGGNLYYQVLKDFARGERTGTPQRSAAGKTFRGAGSYAEARFARELEARQRRAYFAGLGLGRDPHRSPYRRLKYRMMYSLLMAERRRLAAAGQAPIIALYYHRVANDAASAITLPLERFVEQIELIRRHFPIISLAEARRRLESGHNGQIAFVITFDDGYRINCRACIPYLEYFGIPATFFVSAGHVADGRPFAHDAGRTDDAFRPMAPEDVRRTAQGPFEIGSHGLYHEDFGKVRGKELRDGIIQSKKVLGEILGREPVSFAFPIGVKGVNITKESWELAGRHYEVVASAYGGYNFPKDGAKHFKRWCHPYAAASLVQIMDGYRGLTSVLLKRNLWDYRFSNEPPY